LADPVKEKRRGQQAAQAQSGPPEGAQRMAAPVRLPGHEAQTDGAQDAVVVLGDALAAKEMAALRALGGGFARGMIQAMLLGKGQHGV
jgi:hypothetical protein